MTELIVALDGPTPADLAFDLFYRRVLPGSKFCRRR
jgi:hypothetical protein